MTAQAHAVDGDTLGVDLRLLGVDAFERDQRCSTNAGKCTACGEAARRALQQLLFQDSGGRGSRPVVIRVVATSSYGRPIVTATSNGADIGASLIAAGLAIPQPQYLKSDPARASLYESAFAQAKAAKRGGFGGSWITPSDWRRGKRLPCEN